MKTLNGNYIVYQTMNGVQAKLPASNYSLIQNSYLIAINKAKSIEGNTLEIASAPYQPSLQRRNFEICTIKRHLGFQMNVLRLS